MKKTPVGQNSSEITLAIILFAAGGVLLLRALDVSLPRWLFKWEVILMFIGAAIGISSRFKNAAGYILLLIGSVFLLRDFVRFPSGWEDFILPALFISCGIYLLIRKKRQEEQLAMLFSQKQPKSTEAARAFTSAGASPGAVAGQGFGSGEPQKEQDQASVHMEESEVQALESLHINALFTGIERRLPVGSFSGGKFSVYFAGVELDLSNTQLDREVSLHVDVAFGGVKLILPQDWQVDIISTHIFAGVEDKRMPRFPHQKARKSAGRLLITGSVLFGGIELKSY
ncbi:cell wall-active antibiotics response protein [Nitritalea halalkaliphila LW7]|uniref:Cell wall-active antibiotics response protein n=1 Tax=Nitritalea halalkaliphila LW7 TaxID=1189621 RepID=I5C0T8_9BACT|nr:cell wall-active antibiotics response protein [Nitritalea halalkaliphila]EIM75440.1 cell wall-active antibiotics response protein [Nitritalea halalkaliphila LW7]